MNEKDKNSESGQAIIYLVLGLVVFLGFVALAIDGGMVLADRRHAQNLADASSLAGGAAAGLYIEQNRTTMCGYTWSCSNAEVLTARNKAVTAAINRAKENDFSIDDNIGDHNGVNTNCSEGTNKYIDVLVQVTTTTPSNFLQLLSSDVLQNQVEAITRVNPQGPIAFGNAVVALNPSPCMGDSIAGVIVGGSGIVHVTGGDIFSNYCLRQKGDAVKVQVSGGLGLGHELNNIKYDSWDPDPTITSKTVDPNDYKVKPPNCSDPAAHHVYGPSLGKGTNTSLQPGLNCVQGAVSIEKGLSGNGVTIYMEDSEFVIRGNADVNLTAPTDPATSYPAIPGILIYLPENNKSDVILNGTMTSVVTGFIYAPQNTVTLTGTGGNTYTGTQVLGWNVIFTGDSDLYLVYDGCAGYIRPPKIELYK